MTAPDRSTTPTGRTPRPGDHIAPIRFRKKPVEIEAMRWSGNNLREIIDFTGLHPSAEKWTWEEYEAVVAKDGLKIFTLEGTMMAAVGDFIIRGVKGEFYPCKPDIFAASYQPATESNAPQHPWAAQESDLAPFQHASETPAGMVHVPRELTAENGMKFHLSGDFSIRPDPESDVEYIVPWDTIKQIHRRVVELAGTTPASAIEATNVRALLERVMNCTVLEERTELHRSVVSMPWGLRNEIRDVLADTDSTAKDSPYDDPLFVAVNAQHEKERKCGALNCEPPCRCDPPVPPNHKPVS
jgi:hypothetical protein